VEGSQRSSKEGQYQQEHREQPDEEPEEELQHQPTTCAICNTNPVSASAQKLSAFCSKTAKAGGGIPKPVNVFPGPYNIPYIQGEVKKPWLLFKARGNDSLSFSLPVSLCLLLIYPKTLTKKRKKRQKSSGFWWAWSRQGPLSGSEYNHIVWLAVHMYRTWAVAAIRSLGCPVLHSSHLYSVSRHKGIIKL